MNFYISMLMLRNSEGVFFLMGFFSFWGCFYRWKSSRYSI